MRYCANEGSGSMKLRPVFLVVLILVGFYWLSTRLMPAGALAKMMHAGAVNTDATSSATLSGPLGSFGLTEAKAAPAFDSEEEQNIGVYKKAMPSVVNITSTQVAYDFFYRPVPQQGQGSGFVLDKDGHILTNNHVVDGAQQVEVTLWNGKKYKATIVGTDPSHDVALLQIHGATGLEPATLADSSGLLVGQRVYAIGNPFGFSGTMTRGIISALRAVQLPSGMKIDNAIQTDASVNPGNSGGPLLNSHGDVIGITTMIATNPNTNVDQSAGIGFAIPIATAKAVLDDFAKYGHARRPSLDIVTIPIGPDIADQLGLPSMPGILVERVLPGGAAQVAGIHGGTQRMYMGNEPVMLGGDLIVGLDGQEIATPQDLGNALTEHHPGDVVTVTVYRGRKQMSFKVTLSDSKLAENNQSA